MPICRFSKKSDLEPQEKIIESCLKQQFVKMQRRGPGPKFANVQLSLLGGQLVKFTNNNPRMTICGKKLSGPTWDNCEKKCQSDSGGERSINDAYDII